VNPALGTLQRQIRIHNRHCWLAAAAALFFSWLAWAGFYVVFAGVVLLLETIRQGESAAFPQWLNPTAVLLAILLLSWAGAEERGRKFRPTTDRPVIGWHLLPDLLLLPARLTFSIGSHLSARIRLDSHGQETAWRILELAADFGKLPPHLLGAQFTSADDWERALEALQLLGWVDLHGDKEGWFYRIPSTREGELAAMRGLDVPSSDSQSTE